MKQKFCVLSLSIRWGFVSVGLFPLAAAAQFTPIPLTPESFNHDIVVERTAPAPIVPVTTASVETGLTNSGYTWFEKGYNADWPATGLPAAGSIISSDLAPDREYQLAPDYRTNNAVLIDSTSSHAELGLINPAPFAALSFLLSGAHDSIPTPVGYAVHHADGSVEPGTVLCKDWMDSTPIYDYAAHGRVSVSSFTFANLNANFPKLFAAGVTLTNGTSPVTNVELSYVSGAGHSVIMALSGASATPGPFSPIAVTGYNVDVVVEATAARAKPLLSVTTATMAEGSANFSWTWYERGYVPGAAESGLPSAGSIITNVNAPEHVYLLAETYAQNNTALLDADSPAVQLTPANPVVCGTLSLLTAAARGPATNRCVIAFADGSTQTNWVVSPDWTDESTPAAFIAGGRVNINNRMLEDVGGTGPRLFVAAVELKNTTAAVTNISIEWSNVSSGHTAFLAVSGKAAGTPATAATLSIRTEPGGAVVIESSAPGRLESTTALNGASTVWESAGTISGPVIVTPASQPGTRFYRVVAP